MSLATGERIRSFLNPPRYISSPLAGIDLTGNGARAVSLSRTASGLVLSGYGEAQIAPGAYNDGEISDPKEVIRGLWAATGQAGVSAAHVALPQTRAYLFETLVSGKNKLAWKSEAESRLHTLIHIPAHEVSFDVVPVGSVGDGKTKLAGVAASQRTIEAALSVFDDADLDTHSFEAESFSFARALLPQGDESVALLIDVGKAATNMTLVAKRIPRRCMNIPRGGHPVILVLQKAFGVTENEARTMLAEEGILPTPRTGETVSAMLAILAPIRSELEAHLRVWQNETGKQYFPEPITQVILAGTHAAIRGLPEYMEETFGIPVRTGDVFTNLASQEDWMSTLSYSDSLGYATAIGLALRGDIS